MNKKRRRGTLLLVLISVAIGLILLTIGPIVINYIFMAEEVNLNLAFDAGNLLDYYGAVLGGLVTCFAIISAVHINNLNIREDRQREQFEKAYEVYHKLPEMLTKLESAAIRVQYSTKISESELMDTLDTMEACDNILREQHFVNEKYYNSKIDSLLKSIMEASEVCRSVAEQFLEKKEHTAENSEPPHAELESDFVKLRDSIDCAKNEITAEINKFIFKGDS